MFAEFHPRPVLKARLRGTYRAMVFLAYQASRAVEKRQSRYARREECPARTQPGADFTTLGRHPANPHLPPGIPPAQCPRAGVRVQFVCHLNTLSAFRSAGSRKPSVCLYNHPLTQRKHASYNAGASESAKSFCHKRKRVRAQAYNENKENICSCEITYVRMLYPAGKNRERR